MEINERLKQVREYYGLNMRDFAERLGMSHGAISLLETGKRNLTSQFISSVCREFGISEEWLRTGEGEMMRPLEREEEIAKLASKMLDEVEPSIRNAFIRAVMATNNETLQALKDFSETFIHELNNPPTK